MTNSVVAQLRGLHPLHCQTHCTICEAADEIEQLQAQIARLKQPLTFEPVVTGSRCRNCGGHWIPMPGGTLYHMCNIGGASVEPGKQP